MRAVVHDRYGPPEVLRLADVPAPTPTDDEVLVQVHASTVNRTDTGFRQGKPRVVRLFSGLRRPKQPILGSELAGVVEAVGTSVTSFAPGDRVFGVHPNKFGAHAELMCMRESAPLVKMPVNVSFEEAAAVCDGVVLALTYLRVADVQAGQRVLIHGASGSIGTAAVQLAKDMGAEVTAVCHTKNVEIVRSLGADRVIDYTASDWTAIDGDFDLVLDAVGKIAFKRCRQLVKPGGVFMTTDFGPKLEILWLPLLTRFARRRVRFPLPKYTKDTVEYTAELLEQGRYRAVIDRTYPLDEIVEATKYVESEQKTGNVVIRVC
ncbi:MAG: NAD(P)-dependent alcohol dehydrogenase [Actinobacteria bacterium]|nr:NAD(P)-dependent alcohol dehydrogenase [Actinomycetota bacterium]